MDIYPLQQCQPEAIAALVDILDLYKRVFEHSPEQFDLLLQCSQLVDVGPGEVVIEQGQIDTWLYFLVEGGLAVYAGESSPKKVNEISPGEVFGDLAILLHRTRSASVIADTVNQRSIVVRLDFSIFGERDDFEHVSLSTKLVFYRNFVKTLRAKLDAYCAQFPGHVFAAGHRKIKGFDGELGTHAELIHINEESKRLAELLIDWNLCLIDT